MNRLWIIIKKEYMTIVGRKSFFIMTLLLPVFMLLCSALPIFLAEFNKADERKVVVIDNGCNLGKKLKNNDEYTFVMNNDEASKDPRKYFEDEKDKENSDLYAIVILPADMEDTGRLSIFSDKPVANSLVSYIDNTMSDVLTNRNIDKLGIPGIKEKIEQCNANVDIQQIQWGDNGEEESSSAEISAVIGMMLALFSYSFVLMYGSMIMSSVIEEKTNRIVEVIVSSCKPVELMMGKIIGVALVGITQLLIWGFFMVVISFAFGFGGLLFGTTGTAEVLAQMGAQGGDVSGISQDIVQAIGGIKIGQILGSFALYGIGGFLLFGSLFAAFGSAVDQMSDASQFTTPIIILEVFALWAGIACMENPDGPLAFWCSIVPITSPTVMMVRLPFGVPIWELLLSLVLLYGTAFGFIYLAAKIYRRGILMYGKKASFKQLFQWLR